MDDSGLLKVLPVGDISGDFFVPSYQRGYRWTEQEVGQLLDDIRESDGTTYYLQPVVVKTRDVDTWELVDGQQRLTTLYLVLRYLRRTHLPRAEAGYTITYETRKGSKDYLERIREADAGTNIDFFHMFNAYRCIEAWFAQFDHGTREATRLYDALIDRVKVLWYVAPNDVESQDLFTRLNVGRIPLTDAELVKALLLSHAKVGVGLTDRAQEMAAHWDSIERDLRVPEIWSFVTGEADAEATNISLLLDTLAGGPRGRERPPFQTFDSLREQIEGDPQAFWREVVELHSLVLGWYEDRSLYHKVGYLIAAGRAFRELVELAKGKGKSDFEAGLDAEIRGHLNLTSNEVAQLTCGNKTADVLLLMNVETVRAMQDSAERYSFRAHAAGWWSQEHIHAQQAESLRTTEQRRAWLKYHREALADLADIDEEERSRLLDRIDGVLSAEITEKLFDTLEQELTDVFAPADEADVGDIHSIANLALLDQRDNSALNNSVFEVKRRHIIRRDKAGSYIPVCTRNLFLKYYTETGDQQLYFWSAADRQSYLEEMQRVVAPYLKLDGEEA